MRERGPVCRPYDDLSMGAALCARDRQTVSAIPEAHQRLVSDRRDVRACRRGLDVSLPWRRFQRRYPGFLAASDARQEGGHRVLPQDVRRGSSDAPSRGDRGQEPRLPGRVRGRPDTRDSSDPRSNLRQCKYLNNIIEQDHRFIKRRTRPMLGFKRFTTAWRTLRGIEIMHALRKGQARWMAKGDVVGQTQLIHKVFGLAA